MAQGFNCVIGSICAFLCQTKPNKYLDNLICVNYIFLPTKMTNFYIVY